MIRTRVGYAGGTHPNPTYHDLGDHTESIEIDFDPSVIRYEDLLEVFWQEHSGTRPAWSIQYAAFVFAHDEDQERQARASLEERQRELGQAITTKVRRLDRFWRAEDYHQKFRLRHRTELATALLAHYGGERAFIDSTAAARLNGLVSGYGEPAPVVAELRTLDVPERVIESVSQ